MEDVQDSPPKHGFISQKDWPTVLVALPIQLGFLVYLFSGIPSFHQELTPLQQLGFLAFSFHLLAGAIVLSLSHLFLPTGLAPINLSVMFVGGIAVSLLYGWMLCGLFRPFFRREGVMAERLVRMLPGFMALGLAIYVGVSTVRASLPNDERNAIRDIRGLESLMQFYSLTHRPRPKGDAANKLSVLLSVNVHRHGRHLKVDSARLGSDGVYRDPWGSPYAFGWNERPWAYSFGPNRIDEGGKGDDISNWR
jgi:hypothetical protein